MRTICKCSLPLRTLVGNLILDYPRFIASFVITARKHLFCPRLCQEGKQTLRTTDEYSNVSTLPVCLPRCRSLLEKFLWQNRLVVSPPEAAKVQLCIFTWQWSIFWKCCCSQRGYREQRGAWYSNSFRFQIRTMSFVDNPLKHEGCNLRVQGWKKKKCPVDTCGYLSVNHTAGKKLLLVIWKSTAGAPWLAGTRTSGPVSTLWSRPVTQLVTWPGQALCLHFTSNFQTKMCLLAFNVSSVNDSLSQTQVLPKTESTKWHFWKSKCHFFPSWKTYLIAFIDVLLCVLFSH